MARSRMASRADGVFLDYYDVAYDSCNISKETESALGYKRIFLANRDIKVTGDAHGGSEIVGSIFLDSGRKDIFAMLKMDPRAIVFMDMRINKKAMEQMNEKGIALCMPVSAITSSYGLSRSRTLYMMGKMFTHAKSIKLDVAFVTLARSTAHLCSYMQLVELARMLGADEDYARESISGINRSLVLK